MYKITHDKDGLYTVHVNGSPRYWCYTKQEAKNLIQKLKSQKNEKSNMRSYHP